MQPALMVEWRFRIHDGLQVWDWADGAPEVAQLRSVRTPRSTAKSAHLPVDAFSATTGGRLLLESGLEHDLVRELDRQPSVKHLVAQPLVVLVQGATSKTLTRHVPDLVSEDHTGKVTVWDCRHRERQDAKFVEVSRSTAEECARVGWSYQVFTGLSATRRSNLLWLHAYRRSEAWHRPFVPTIESMIGATGCTLGDVRTQDRGLGLLLATTWNLIWAGRIGCSLDRPFTMDTPLIRSDGFHQ